MPLTNYPQIIGLVYALLALPLIAYLGYTGRMNRIIATLFLLTSVLLGFLIFSPMVPYQLQQAITGAGPGPGKPSLFIIGGLIVLFLVLTFAAGRIFCAQICPIGAVQELFYTDPKQKFLATEKKNLMVLRGIVFILFIALGIFSSVALLGFFGIREFFFLEFESIFFTVFVLLLVISLFFSRPFCRLICPEGVLFSLTAAKGLCKLRRTGTCIPCGNCERACPTGVAGAADNKMECYLCGRCTRVCPQEGALVYKRDNLMRNEGAK